MRGARVHVLTQVVPSGIIPAYAGSTLAVLGQPRDAAGSSPRMRGAPVRPVVQGPRRRIIPAYAGSTDGVQNRQMARQDHPRVCGEHYALHFCPPSPWGSSPRMRGAHTGRSRMAKSMRIIPAYAGSTAPRRRPSNRGWDHPRVCGEHATLSRMPVSPSGSSPRMRGAQRTGQECQIHSGIIPAYAGSTPQSMANTVRCKDHPRVCGEHLEDMSPWKVVQGSSPRMRGALPRCLVGCDCAGIIPAYAGSTSCGAATLAFL